MEALLPIPLLHVFIDDQALRLGQQNLQGLEKLDDLILLICAKRLEGFARGERFGGVGEHCFAHGGEFAVVHEGQGLRRSKQCPIRLGPPFSTMFAWRSTFPPVSPARCNGERVRKAGWPQHQGGLWQNRILVAR